ncbi:MAG: tetratricopeptide repeat protein, partial [Alistipes sp.]|nr:tetratricopeptide repeat protein [Alistipes sp.]
MRRKLLILALLLCTGSVSLWAQPKQVDRSLERAISLYDLGHWIEARTEFQRVREGLSAVHDRFHIEKIDYYLALCDSQLKLSDAEGRMKRYLAEYGGSAYANDVQFGLGAHYCMVGDDVKAEMELKKVDYRTLSPAQKDQYDLRMGYMAFKRGDYPDAERYFSRIVPTSEYADHATYYKSYMAYARGDYDVARNGFTSLTQSPLYRDLMPYYLMQIDFKSGNYRAVVNSGDALMQNTTEEHALQIRRMMAESWFQLDDYEGAVKYMNAYKSSGGKMGRLENYIMGYSLHRQTLYADALPYLRETCGADDMLTQNASYHLADCYLRSGDKSNAMRSFAMASSAAFDKDIAEDALFNYGKLQYELGGGVFNEAINVLGRYIELYPRSPRTEEARKLLIAAYYNSHNYAEAYDAIKSLPNPDGDALLALQKIAYFNGLESYMDGDLEAAEASLSESMSVGSNAKYNALASLWLGEIAYAKGETGVAMQRYRNFIARAPKTGEEYAMAQYNLGYCYFNNQNMPSAAEAFDKFLSSRSKRDSYRADAYNRRGDVHYSNREFAEAIACYDNAISINTAEKYYAQYQRAITLGVQNKRQEKIQNLQR